MKQKTRYVLPVGEEVSQQYIRELSLEKRENLYAELLNLQDDLSSHRSHVLIANYSGIIFCAVLLYMIIFFVQDVGSAPIQRYQTYLYSAAVGFYLAVVLMLGLISRSHGKAIDWSIKDIFLISEMLSELRIAVGSADYVDQRNKSEDASRSMTGVGSKDD